MRVPNAGLAKASLPCFCRGYCAENVAENQFTPAFHSVLSWDRHFFPVNKRLSLPELTALFPSPLLNLIWTKIDEQTLNGRLPTNNLRSWEKLYSSPSLKKSSSCLNSDEMAIFFRNREDRGCCWCWKERRRETALREEVEEWDRKKSELGLLWKDFMVFGWLSDGRTGEEADAADTVSLLCLGLVLKW
jgi:hypothetical protein